MAAQRKNVKPAARAAKKKPAKKQAARKPAAKTRLTAASFDTTTSDAEKLRAQVLALLEENKRLAEELDACAEQGTAVEKAAADAVRLRTQAEKELAATKTALETQTKKVTELTSRNTTLTQQVKRLSAEVEKQPLHPLTPEEAAGLIERTLGSFRSGTLVVREADLTLKVATAKLGTEAVLVLPEPGAADPATLHELKLSLTRTSLSEEAIKLK
jgi:hypothetical protein